MAMDFSILRVSDKNLKYAKKRDGSPKRGFAMILFTENDDREYYDLRGAAFTGRQFVNWALKQYPKDDFDYQIG